MKSNRILQALALLVPLCLTACGESKTPPAPAAEISKTSKGAAEPGKDAGHDEGSHVELSAAQIKAADIEVIQAGPAGIRETLPLYGVIAPNAERMRDVAARYPGIIRSVGKKIGDPVKQGETLATVESNESLQTYAVTAPLSGVVTARNANTGEQSADKVLFTVADLSTVWIELSLFPRDVAKARVGQRVRVKNNDAGLTADGKVVYVAPFGSSASQTFIARVQLDNAERRWAPGLYVSAEITLAETPVPLAVRNDAIQNLEGRNVVFVAEGDGFEARPVELGRNDGEYTELISGLKPGDRYAARNSFILKAEMGKGEAEHGH